jgi:hypothetical protein
MSSSPSDSLNTNTITTKGIQKNTVSHSRSKESNRADIDTTMPRQQIIMQGITRLRFEIYVIYLYTYFATFYVYLLLT